MEKVNGKEKYYFFGYRWCFTTWGNQMRFDHNLDELMVFMGDKYGTAFTDLSLDKYDVGAVYYDWDKPAVERLRNLCDQTGASIVISSAWRESKSLEKLKALFRFHLLDQYVIGATVVLREKYRGDEIKEYVDTHDDIKNFVILDDVSYGIIELFPKQFVHCRNNLGKEEYEKGLRILRGEA